jgi:DNA-directed RNA polymerase subunit RPC12/RpoP
MPDVPVSFRCTPCKRPTLTSKQLVQPLSDNSPVEDVVTATFTDPLRERIQLAAQCGDRVLLFPRRHVQKRIKKTVEIRV